MIAEYYTLRLAQSNGAAKSSHTQERPYTGTPLYPVPEAAMVGSLPITAMGSSLKAGPGDPFSTYDAASAANDWHSGGEFLVGYVGCGIGALGTIEDGGYGCTSGGQKGAAIGGAVFGPIGWLLGGYHLPGAELFSWGPDQTKPWPWEGE